MAAEPKLTDKQRVFIAEYVKCWNATEAARRAGYVGNAVTIRAVGTENLAKPHIKAAIDAKVAEIGVSADEVLLRLGEHARAEHSRFWKVVSVPPVEEVRDKDDKVIIPAREGYETASFDLVAIVKAGLAHLIKKLSYDKCGNQVVEFHDPQAALVHLGKHHKLFTEKVEVEGHMNLTVKAEELTDDELAAVASTGGN